MNAPTIHAGDCLTALRRDRYSAATAIYLNH